MDIKKSLLYFVLNIALLVQFCCAQSIPKIAYNTPVILVDGQQISTLSPTNAGGPVYAANYSSPSFFLDYNTPFSIVIDTEDNVYTTSKASGEISKYNAKGTLLFNINSGHRQATGVAVDALGNIYVSQFTANTVLKYNAAGELLATINGFNDPYGIAFDSNNNAYVANYLDGKILKIANGDTVATTYVTGLTNPYGITIDGTNTMYVSEQSVGDIIKIIPGSLTKTIFSSGFNGPRHLSKDKFGNIYVADFGNHAIKKINPLGTISTVSNQVSFPRQAAFDSSGNLFVADFGSNTLKRSNATNYSISDSLPAGLNFNALTGEITGRPTGVSSVKTYIITAYNTAGSHDFPLVLSVVEPEKDKDLPIKPTDTTLIKDGIISNNHPSPSENNTLKSPRVTANIPTFISSNSAVLIGYTEGNGANTTVSFFYSDRPDFANSVPVVAMYGGNISPGTTSANTLTIEGLKPFTRYYYYLKAVNEFGISISNTISFSTLSVVNTDQSHLTDLQLKTPDQDKVIVHQAVSPNGDGINDFFKVEGLENYPNNKVTILSRSGAKVYEARGYDNLNKFFDGHSNISGGFQQQGTYYYQIEYAINQENKRKLGYFILKY